MTSSSERRKIVVVEKFNFYVLKENSVKLIMVVAYCIKFTNRSFPQDLSICDGWISPITFTLKSQKAEKISWDEEKKKCTRR